MPPVHKQKAFLPLTSRRRGTRQDARGKEMLPQYEFQMTLIAPYKGLDARIFRQVAKDLRCRIKFMDLAFDEAIEAAKRLSPDTCDVVVGFTVISYLIGLFGLKTIIVSTIPVLMFIYPLCVALIALIFLHKFFGGRQCVYAWTMGFTFVMALVNGAETAGISMTGLEEVLKAYVPLHTYGMGWIPFAIVGFVIGLIWKVAVPAKAQNAAA